MFVDASALVAILAHEPNCEELTSTLETASRPLTSGIAILEAVMAVGRLRAGTVAQAEKLVRDLIVSADVTEIPITSAETRIALSAYARYGKGQGHPAQLNMGDCFAYACASVHDVPLLFVGDDFSQTDIRPATA